MLTRSRAELRSQLRQDPGRAVDGVRGAPSSRANKGLSAVPDLAPLSGLAPHIDRTTALDFGFLLRQVEQYDASRIHRLVKAAEKRFAAQPDPALAAELKQLEPGETAMVPFTALRPGQAQLSFAHAGTKVAKFLGKLDGHSPDELSSLVGALGLLEVPCVIGPGGRFAVIHDRHHHMSGLMALIGWTDELINRGQALHMGKPGPELSTMQALFGRDVPQVQIVVTENLSHLSESEFLEAAAPYLHRETAAGAVAPALPTEFSQLDDNPFRFLASATKIKVERTGDGRRDFELETKSEADALWIKPPSAPDFIEFHIGKIFRAAFAEAGQTYDPKRGLSADDRQMLRAALIAARDDMEHPSHDVLQSIVIKPDDISVEDFKDHIKVGRKKGHVRLKD